MFAKPPDIFPLFVSEADPSFANSEPNWIICFAAVEFEFFVYSGY